MKTRSGLRESPVMRLGDKKEGRSAYNKQSENEENNNNNNNNRKL